MLLTAHFSTLLADAGQTYSTTLARSRKKESRRSTQNLTMLKAFALVR
jgi:hypothetical protein